MPGDSIEDEHRKLAAGLKPLLDCRELPLRRDFATDPNQQFRRLCFDGAEKLPEVFCHVRFYFSLGRFSNAANEIHITNADPVMC